MGGMPFYVVANEGAAESGGTAVGVATMDKGSIKKQDVARPHLNRNRGHIWGNRHRLIGIALREVGFHTSQNGELVRSRNHDHTAVFFVAIIQREPGRDTGSGRRTEVKVVLV